jgi:hypothetical protein
MTKNCLTIGCNREVAARGYCRPCYYRLIRNGSIVPHTQTPKRKHVLLNINVENATATCLACGPVKVRKSGNEWKCRTSINNVARNIYKRQYEIKKSMMIDKCSICNSKKSLCWDHNHETGNFRGTLCPYCNTAIGLLKNDPQIIEKAISYLSKEKPKLLKTKCLTDGCKNEVLSRGYCSACYYRLLRHGNFKSKSVTSKWKHRLSEINEINHSAICASCGPVRITKRSKTKWRCAKEANERTKIYKQAYRLCKSSTLAKSCEICGSINKLCWDHCHKTGLFRGTLCNNCNTSLGLFFESKNRLQKAIDYLNNGDPRPIYSPGPLYVLLLTTCIILRPLYLSSTYLAT